MKKIKTIKDRRAIGKWFSKIEFVRGFTLVETLVAIAVLLLAISGPLTIASRSFFAARFSKDNLTAVYLAGEGVELVRAHRAKNILEGSDWLSGLDSCLSGNKCRLHAFNDSVGSCSDGVCQPLGMNPENYAFFYNSAIPDSRFTREIEITEISSTEIDVTSRVVWSNGLVDRAVEINETLHDW